MNALFLFNNAENLEKEIRKNNNYEKIYVVSSNLAIKDLKLFNLDKIEFILLDSDCTIFSNETWVILEKINKVINSLQSVNENFLYEASYLIEGGYAQKVADVLYSINIFNTILKRIKADYFVCEERGTIEAIALECIATNRKQIIKYAGYNKGAISNIKKTLLGSNCSFVVWAVNLYLHFKCMYSTYRIWKNNKTEENSNNYDVGIIFTSDAIKHYNWLLDAINSYRETMKYCIICYHADEARKKFQQSGISVVSVETYFRPHHMLLDYISYLKDIRIIRKSLNNMEDIYFQGVLITAWIKDGFLKDIAREKLENIFYYRMIDKFLRYNRFRLLTGDGDTNFISNRIFAEVLKKQNISTEMFKDTTGVDIINVEKGRVYEPYSYTMNIRFFTKKSTYLKALTQAGWKGTVYELPPSNRLEFSNEMYKMNNEIPIVLWAPSYPLRGHYSICNFLEDNEYVLRKFTDKKCRLYVKYHPNQPRELIEDYIREFRKVKNIKFIEKQESILDYVQEADLIITTPSTVIMDAAEKNKPVICIVNSNNYQMVKHLRKGFLIVKRHHIGVDKLLNLYQNKDLMEKVALNCVQRQVNFLNEYYEGYKFNSVKEVLEAILRIGI